MSSCYNWTTACWFSFCVCVIFCIFSSLGLVICLFFPGYCETGCEYQYNQLSGNSSPKWPPLCPVERWLYSLARSFQPTNKGLLHLTSRNCTRLFSGPLTTIEKPFQLLSLIKQTLQQYYMYTAAQNTDSCYSCKYLKQIGAMLIIFGVKIIIYSSPTCSWNMI